MQSYLSGKQSLNLRAQYLRDAKQVDWLQFYSYRNYRATADCIAQVLK